MVGAEVDRLGPHHDLDRLGERVQEPSEAGHQRLLLGRGAQAKVTALARQISARPSPPRSTIPSPETPPTGRRSGAGAGPARSARKVKAERGCRRGRARVGGELRWWRQAATSQRSAGTPSNRPSAKSRGRRGDGDGNGAERGDRHHVPGGGIADPQDDGGDGQDGELAGGEPGQELVGPLDVSRYADAALVPSRP